MRGKVSMLKPARYICIHGHFYQPPRENPWLEQVETQDSASVPRLERAYYSVLCAEWRM